MILKIIRVILQLSVIGAGSYTLFTKILVLTPLVMLLAGLIMLVTGFERIEKNQKEFWGCFCGHFAVFIDCVMAKLIFDGLMDA
ncbi:hypothetical protein [Planococcus sp. SSTMD024]|uniref:hypothetical protein n=1 Tax=Planococcus sp. SSTMD024 TaxID=3242163 RepID=UPI00351DCFD9